MVNSYVTLLKVSSCELRSVGKAGVMATIFSAHALKVIFIMTLQLRTLSS